MTYPSQLVGIDTETFRPADWVPEFSSLIVFNMSTSALGLWMFADPRYVTPEKTVQSWSEIWKRTKKVNI